MHNTKILIIIIDFSHNKPWAAPTPSILSVVLCVSRYIFQKTLIIIIEIFLEETLGHPHPLGTLSLFCSVFERLQYEKFK